MTMFLLGCLIISNALTLRKDKSILFSRITLISLLIAAFLAFNNFFAVSLDKGVGLFGGLFHATSFTHCFNIFILIISAFILIYTSFYSVDSIFGFTTSFSPNQIIKRLKKSFSYVNFNIPNSSFPIVSRKSDNFRILEYSLIIVFVLSGAIFLMSASDLISVFLSIELQSYGLYIISTIYRDSEKATIGGLTYFLLGGLSSCFILLGSALLYVNSGTTSLDGIYLISSVSDITSDLSLVSNTLVTWYNPFYLHLSLIILSVGFLFKVSAAPFHFWSPDVYDNIPTIVTMFVAIIAKISIFMFFLELVYFTKENLLIFSWTNCLIISSLFSLIVGSILGLTQFRIKRLYAYSTINHVGFMLLALAINSIESIQAYIFYIITYTISNLNAFIILITIGYSFYNNINIKDRSSAFVQNSGDLEENITDKENSPVQLIKQLKGYFYINPYLALSLSITLFSFVGVPPLIGFFAKQMVLSAALDNGYVFMSLIAIITSVIGAVYYLNIIRYIFFYVHFNSSNLSTDHLVDRDIYLNSIICFSISILTLILVLFIYTPNEWFNLANILVLLLYIR